MDFIRWGAMSPQKHEEAKLPYDSKKRDFYTAPTVWGIYAFPKGFVYGWLLGMPESDLRKNNRFRWFKDAAGNIVRENDITEHIYDDNNRLYSENKFKMIKRLNKVPKISNWDLERDDNGYAKDNARLYWDGQTNRFKYGGEIWHHLELFQYEYCDIKYHFPDKIYPIYSKKNRIVPLPNIIARSGSWVKTSIRDYRKALKKFDEYLRYSRSIGHATGNKNVWWPVFDSGDLDMDECFEVFIEKV